MNKVVHAVIGALVLSSTIYPFSIGHAQENNRTTIIKYSPVPVNLKGKNPALVRKGSYLVNAVAACNDCHTSPAFAENGNPYQGQQERINTARFLAGGTPFGPTLISPNITPDNQGLPAGLTLDKFIETLRTGKDPHDPTMILQVMPWPVYGKMANGDLRAIYEYLRAIPSVP